MPNKKNILILALAIAVLLFGALFAYNRLGDSVAVPKAPDTTEAPIPVPDFAFTDLDGNPVTFADFKGKPVVLNFWATWCGYCVKEMPDFEALYGQYGDDVQFVMMNAGESADTARDFLDEQGYTFPGYLDSEGQAVGTFGVYAYPATAFITADGSFLYGHSGLISAEALEEGILDLLG